MGHEGIPREVQEARKKGDHRALSAMGKAGGRQAAENRLLRKELQRRNMEERVEELARNETVTEDGEVLPGEPPVKADGIIYH